MKHPVLRCNGAALCCRACAPPMRGFLLVYRPGVGLSQASFILRILRTAFNERKKEFDAASKRSYASRSTGIGC